MFYLVDGHLIDYERRKTVLKKILFSLLLVVFLCASFCIPASATFSIFNYPGGVPPKSSLYLLVNYDYYLHINGTTYYVPSGTTIYEGVTSQYTCTARRALDYCDDLDSRFNCGIGDLLISISALLWKRQQQTFRQIQTIITRRGLR